MRPLAASVLCVCVLVAAGPAWGRRPPLRLHLTLDKVTVTEDAPEGTAEKARALFDEIVADRPEVVRVEGRGVRSLSVMLNVDELSRKVGPDERPGASGRMLTVIAGVKLLGATVPTSALAMAGSGRATVMSEVGRRVRPREEQLAIDAALREALTAAIDEAIVSLVTSSGKKHGGKPVRH